MTDQASGVDSTGDEATEIATLIDTQALDLWLQSQKLKNIEPLKVSKLKGGASNEMFVLSFESNGINTEWILRRSSGIAWEKAEKGLQREYRLLKALTHSDIPTPAAIALCTDKTAMGSIFYIMEKINGFTPAMQIPKAFTADASLIKATAYAGLDALAKLHQIDWRAVGLEDYGKPDDFHQRQVGRWTSQLDSYVENYGGRELPALKKIGEWLQQNLPSNWTPTIMHGDYHPLNIMMGPELPPRIVAIVDWETSTIGDPFLDLVGFLDIWYDANAGIDWPSYDEMVAYYLSLVDYQAENFVYYQLLYYFRQSVLLEGIYQRSLVDKTRDNQDAIGEHVLRMIDRAEKLL